MEQKILKPGIRDKVKTDPILFGKVAKSLDISPRTLLDLLPANPPRIATASVLNVILEHVKDEKDNQFFEYEDLLTEETVNA